VKKTLAGLDISENFVTCSICSADEKGGITLLGTASAASRGIDNGAISDIGEAALSIASAIEKAEAMAKTKVVSLVVSCDGVSLRAYNIKGSITVAEKENEIGRREIQRVTEAAKTIALPFDREIVHSITRGFILDGQDGIRDPAGMFGTRLEVDMEFATALISNLHNLRKSVNTAGFEIKDIVLSGVAAGRSILEELEKELGVIFIYISYSTTHIVVYNGGEIKSIEIIPAGSGGIIGLIADNFKIPRDYAENFLKHEVVLDKAAPEDQEIDDVVLRLGSSSRSISISAAADTIKPKIGELIKQICETVGNMRSAKDAAMGCVVAGDLASLGGFLEILELSLSMPVKMGFMKGVSGDDSTKANTGQIVSIGLVKYWAKEGTKKKAPRHILSNTPLGKVFDRINRIFSDYF